MIGVVEKTIRDSEVYFHKSNQAIQLFTGFMVDIIQHKHVSIFILTLISCLHSIDTYQSIPRYEISNESG